jgi:hypothetical protein
MGVKMSSNIRIFIEQIKNPEELIEGCRKFHEIEPRDIAYIVPNEFVLKNPNNPYYILAGIKIIIITWNAVRFQRLNKELKGKLESEILSSYEESKDMLDKIKNERLETLNLNDNNVAEIIKNCFKVFSEKKSIGITGAAKALHLINPKVFMMWDDKIKKAYHTIHPSYRKRKEPIEECYLEFMKISQEIAKNVLEKVNYEELWKNHLSFLDKNFVDAFSFRETITKMIDECNFVKFTKKINFKANISLKGT